MKVQELLEELLKYSKVEINYALTQLMLKGKLDFVDVSNIYVKTLELIQEDKQNLLIEASCCLLQQFMDGSDEDERQHIFRSLYLLDLLKYFNIEDLKKKFNYDEEEAKELSWYYRQKQL